MIVINYEALAVLGLLSFVLAKVGQGLKRSFSSRWEKLGQLGREIAGYAFGVSSGILIWFVGLNAFPIFSPSWIGLLITSIVGALGPSFVYDVWLDRPRAPPKE